MMELGTSIVIKLLHVHVDLGHHSTYPRNVIFINTMGMDYHANKHIIRLLVLGDMLGTLSFSTY